MLLYLALFDLCCCVVGLLLFRLDRVAVWALLLLLLCCLVSLCCEAPVVHVGSCCGVVVVVDGVV